MTTYIAHFGQPRNAKANACSNPKSVIFDAFFTYFTNNYESKKHKN